MDDRFNNRTVIQCCRMRKGKETKPGSGSCRQTGNFRANELEEKTITGKISDIKNVMFILDDGRDAYVFPLEEGTTLEGIQDGDQVQVTYTGELSLTGDSELNTVKVEKIK